MNQAAIAKQLSDWHITPQPERLTELYFNKYDELPKSLTAGATQPVIFTVRNLEHQTVTYHYKLFAVVPDSDVEQPLGDGTFILEHDTSYTPSPDITVPALGARIGIKVELYYASTPPGKTTEGVQTQSINYWAFVTNTRANS